MRLVYFDCVGGAAGDMLLGSLISAGAPLPMILEGLRGLSLDGYRVEVETTRAGVHEATRLLVDVTEDHPHRTLTDILHLLEKGALPEGARRRAIAVFRRLATAEARVHGEGIDEVHFHEVGAVDALVDIVGTALALDHLGLDSVRHGPLQPGHGVVDTAHGLLPVPTPATLELLTGVPIRLGGEPGEWVTPTGAAILTALGEPVRSGPCMRVERVGVGCGSRRRRERPNIIRALVGELVEEDQPGMAGDDAPGEVEEISILEAVLDDITPEALAHAADSLRGAGALDVLLTPVVMKKGRSGVNLQLLAPSDAADRLARRVLAETSTLGVRLRREQRLVLPRRIVEVETAYGRIRIKETTRPASVPGAPPVRDGAPEAADVARAAGAAGVSFQAVAAAAGAAYRRDRTDAAGESGGAD
jgi:uncharacterized protein (TIGR00299 family) protein